MANRFQQGSGCYRCQICGQMTRETGEGESANDMCLYCWREAGLENEYSDGHITYDEFKEYLTETAKELGRPVPKFVD